MESSLQLLYLCDSYKEWCIKQIDSAVAKHINKRQQSMAAKLVAKYFLNNEDTHEKGMNYTQIGMKG